MIGFLRGYPVNKQEGLVVLDVGGVGYNVFVSNPTLQSLPGRTAEITLYTYLQVREDAMTLYGFLSPEDLKMFKLLITVNGIGPKAALGIFQVFSANDLKFAIVSADARALSRAPGIGARTAQRIIMELKDRVSLEDAFEERSENSVSAVTSDAVGEAVEGLTALGYSASEALKAVHQVEHAEALPVEELLKAALKLL